MKQWNGGDIVYAADLNANFAALTQVVDPVIMAAANLLDRNALYLAPYQSDGGITYDNQYGYAFTQANTTYTVSYTTGGGSNMMMVVFVAWNGANGGSVTGITYNGVAMTQIDSAAISQYGLYSFILPAPAAGAHNLVITTGGSGSNAYAYTVYTYSNVAQSTTPDGHAKTTTLTNLTITPTVNGALAIGSGYGDAFSSGLANHRLGYTNGNVHLYCGDSGVVVPPAAQPYTWITNPSTLGAIISLAPFTAPTFAVGKANASVAATANTFIGFAVGAASQGANATVRAVGVIDGLAGLIPGVVYYLANSDGAISVAAGAVTKKVGVAISATQLLITNV